MQNQQLIKREDWVLDREAKDCNKCGKPFNVLLRRKHHCRGCGKVFCDECSENFLDGEYFQLLEKKEKKVRLCDVCYDELVFLLGKQGIVVKQKTRSINDKNSSTSTGSPALVRRRHSKSFNVNDQNAANQSQMRVTGPKPTESDCFKYDKSEDSLSTLDKSLDPSIYEIEDMKKCLALAREYLETNIKAIVEIQTKQYDIYDNWYETIIAYVKQAIKDVQIDTINRDKSMNIKDYIRIKKIPFINHSATQYMKGIICRKNVAHKKMQTYIKKGSILVVLGKLDLEISTIDNFAKSEKKQLQAALDRIELMQPHIIFVEKTVNINLLNDLQKKNIIVAQNFSEALLQRICTASGCYPVKAQDLFTKNVDVFLGVCDKLIFVNYEPESITNNLQVYEQLDDENKSLIKDYLAKNKNRDNTILFISFPNARNFSSISISGPKIHDLQHVKQCIKQAAELAYQMTLELEMIAVDLRLKCKLLRGKISQSVYNPMITCGDITNFIYTRLNEDELNRSNQLKITKLKYVPADLSTIHDVSEQNLSVLRNYIFENKENFNNAKIMYFCQNCEIIRDMEIVFYQNTYDHSLGQDIILKAANFDSSCKFCKQQYGSHVTILYGAGGFVRIEMEKKNKTQIQLRNSLQAKESFEVTHLDDSTIQERQNSANLVQDIPQTISQKDINVIEKKNLDEIVNKNKTIDLYLECIDCKEILTEKLRLKRIHLEFSYYKFIQHLLVNTIKHHSSDKSKGWLNNTIPSQSECQHKQIVRVFICDDTKIKFYANIFKVYRVEYFYYNSENVKQNIIQYDLEQIETRRTTLMETINKCQSQFIVYLDQSYAQSSRKSSTSLQTLDSVLKPPKQTIDKLEELKQSLLARIQFGNFPTFLHLEAESMKVFQQFVDFIRAAKAMIPQAESIQNLKKLLTGTTMKQSEELKQVPNQQQAQQPPKDTMLSFLINTKTIEKEITKQQKKKIKKVETMKKSQPLVQKPVILKVDRSSMKTDIKLEGEYSDHNSEPESDNMTMNQDGITQYDTQMPIHNDKFYSSISLKELWPRLALNYSEVASNNQLLPFIPIYNIHDVSVIGYALNSPVHTSIYIRNEFSYYSQHQVLQREFISKMFSICNDQDSVLTVKIVLDKQPKAPAEVRQSTIEQNINISPQSPLQPIPEENDLSTQQSLPQSQFQQNNDTSQQKQNKKKSKTGCEVIVYYPKQFECVRMLNSISIEQFIKSLASCSSWDSEGGKSGSLFFKSADNLFIFKAVKDSEFFAFDEFAPKYFQHVYKNEGTNSVLNKIYGMFEVRTNKSTTYFIAMENLFYGMSGDLLVYDLKGSEAKRWNRKNGKTLLDTNYIIDRNGEPLPIIKEHYGFIKQALINDSEFLDFCYVVDYSLLLVIDKKNYKVKMGIIDYLQQYNLKKQVENRFKTVINLGFDPTIVRPTVYKIRFQEAMDKYFMGISQSL